MTATKYPYISVDDAGVARVDGTRIKVAHLVAERMAYDWDAEQTRRAHPSLSMAQIHSALAYYFDHQDELDRAVEEGAAKADEFFADLPPSPLRAKLAAVKLARHRP